MRARNAAKEQERAEFRERERERERVARERGRKREREREKAREQPSTWNGQPIDVEKEWAAREKAREQPRPAPSGEPAAKRQRCLATELKELKSEISRYNKLTKEEAKTFQKQQMRIWHPDKRAGMDHTQEEREHAVHMLNVVMGKHMQKMAMDNK